MIKKLTAFLLSALIVFSASAAGFGLDRSIQPVNDVGNIDNHGRSVGITWEGVPARVYYGSSGISIVTQSGEVHLDTNFEVLKLIACKDINGDGCPDFLTYQNAPDHSAQVMTISGRDGKVLADLHLTRSGNDSDLGLSEKNSFVQQLLSAEDGNALIVYDYSIIKVELSSLEIIWSFSTEDNIWKAVSAGDINGDGTEDFACTMQRNTVAVISGADGSLIRDWHPCEVHVLDPGWAGKKVDGIMNMWDLVFMNGIIYATSEDGQIFAIDPKTGDCSGTDIGAIDKEYFDNLLIGFNLSYDMGGLGFRQTGINDWAYMGYRIADTDGRYILIDCYRGDADSCAQYQDSNWPSQAALYDTETGTVEALIPLSSGFSSPYLKGCLAVYEGTPCIALVTSCFEGSASVSYYDYTGALIYQKEIASSVIGNTPRCELSADGEGLRLEFFGAGCITASMDLKDINYAYDTAGVALVKAPDGSYFISESTNGIKERIRKFEGGLDSPAWEYVLSAEFANKGMEYIRSDRDYDGDGKTDIMAIVNEQDNEGTPKASWFILISGADGSELFNNRIKTGEGRVDGKKVEYFLLADSLDMIRDLDGDKKPELLCGETIVSSRRRTVIGSLYGGVDAEGRSFKVGDTNADGLPDFLVVSDKETRLYQSRLGMSYGFASVEYRKTNTFIKNNKDLDPMNTSDLIGDIDADGISEIVLIGKNAMGFQTYKVYNGKTLELLYDLCPDGITSEGESYISLGYDINGDGINELYSRNMNWEYCINDGKTGEMLVNLSTAGRGEGDIGGVITFGPGGGKGDYHPDYLIPFSPLQDTPMFIITSDVDGDGLGDITQILSYWDNETYMPLKKLIIIGTASFEVVSEVKLGAGDGYSEGDLLKVEGSDRYAAVLSVDKLSLLDLSEQKLLADYSVSAKSALQINNDIVVTTPSGELLKLNMDKSFTLKEQIPEQSEDHILELSWTPAQEYSIMTIKDNGTTVYLGSETSVSIPLMQGEHEISLSMNDGQGKTYSELHHINISEQKSFPVLPAVLTGVLLIACLFFGILRKARIAGTFKEAGR